MLTNFELLRQLSFLGPEMILTLAILILLALGMISSLQNRRLLYTILAVAAVAGGLLTLLRLPPPAPNQGYLGNIFVWDWLTCFFKIFFGVAAVVTILLTHASRGEIGDAEYNESLLLVLAVTAGMMLLAAAGDLLMIYLAFETMGILSYLLVGIKAGDARSGEAALKYVLYGAFTSGAMLFGFSLLFGLAGSTALSVVSRQVAAAALHPRNHLLLVLAMLFFLAGLLYKTASFPFHFWCPDVYEGAPTPVTAFLSVGPKAAGFGLFIR